MLTHLIIQSIRTIKFLYRKIYQISAFKDRAGRKLQGRGKQGVLLVPLGEFFGFVKASEQIIHTADC